MSIAPVRTWPGGPLGGWFAKETVEVCREEVSRTRGSETEARPQARSCCPEFAVTTSYDRNRTFRRFPPSAGISAHVVAAGPSTNSTERPTATFGLLRECEHRVAGPQVGVPFGKGSCSKQPIERGSSPRAPGVSGVDPSDYRVTYVRPPFPATAARWNPWECTRNARPVLAFGTGTRADPVPRAPSTVRQLDSKAPVSRTCRGP